jgi:hypothetical protein
LLVCVLTLRLQIKQGFVQYSILLVKAVVVVPFLEKSLPLSLEVLLCDLGLFLLYSLLPLEMLLSNVWVLL